jgi:hypothetical protein
MREIGKMLRTSGIAKRQHRFMGVHHFHPFPSGTYAAGKMHNHLTPFDFPS